MKKQEFNDSILGTLPDTRIAEITNKHASWIWRRRQKLQIPVFASSLPRFNYNIQAFDIINQESAYWLGFYFSDGCVCKSKNRHLVCLSSIDEEIVAKLSFFYGLNHDDLITKTRTSSGKISYNLQLCNKILFDRLVSLGCVERKSLILNPPKISSNFHKAFLMGVFDGDGSVSLNKSINQWKVSISTGSKAFANWIFNHASQLNLIPKFETRNKKNKKKPFFNIVLVGHSGKIFLDHLYGSVKADLPMTRKKLTYFKLSEIQKWKNPNFQDWEIDLLLSNKNLSIVSKLIYEDKRNYGWKRNINCLRRKKNSIKKKSKLFSLGGIST